MQPSNPITAKRIATTSDQLVIVLADREVRIPWQRCSAKLAAATDEQRQHPEPSPAGHGRH